MDRCCHGVTPAEECTECIEPESSRAYVQGLDAEIARLKAEVAALRVDHERAIGTLTVSGVALDVHSTMSMTTHVESVVSQVRGLLRENQALRLDLARHKRALAAGPAALRAKAPRLTWPWSAPGSAYESAAVEVEAAQEAAMKEGK